MQNLRLCHYIDLKSATLFSCLLLWFSPNPPTPSFWAPPAEQLWGICRSCIWSGHTESRASEHFWGWKPSWAGQPAPPWQSSRCSTPGWGSKGWLWVETGPECRETTRGHLPRAESPGYWPGHSPGDKSPVCTWLGSESAYQPHQPWSSAWNNTEWVDPIA